MMVADRRMYLDKTKQRIVEEGDPEAAYLFASVGDELSNDVVDKYGLRPLHEARPYEVKADLEAVRTADLGTMRRKRG